MMDNGCHDAEDLIQNVIDTMDLAHNQSINLTELLESLQQAKQQVVHSSEVSRSKVKDHFERVKKMMNELLTERMTQLLNEIDLLETKNLEPLIECEDMINHALTDASTCMEQGKEVLENSPESNIEGLLKFKDLPETKHLNILPEVPSLSDVAYIDVGFSENLNEELRSVLDNEGCVHDRAPVQIVEIEERPGGLLVTWEEIDEDLEVAEFWLQFCAGQVSVKDISKTTFRTMYKGPHTFFNVKQLRAGSPYSFRVCCRTDGSNIWSAWSVPRLATTNISHYEWDDTTEGYRTSNDNKTGTRECGLTRVLYSKTASYQAGFPIKFKVLGTGENSPVDGVGISITNEDIDTMRRDGAAFLGTDGTVYVDGQEMKTKLPGLSRNTVIHIETEMLPSGKLRITMQTGDKELTFDWKIDRQVTLGLIGGTALKGGDDFSTQCFYFGMHFSHEDWKIAVE